MRPVCLHEGRLVECSGRMFYARKTASQLVTSGSFATLTGLTVDHLGAFTFAGNTATVAHSGVYHVRAHLVHSATSNSSLVRVMRNGVEIPAVTAIWTVDAAQAGVALYETVVELATGDELIMQVRRTGGLNRNVTAGFWMMVGPH